MMEATEPEAILQDDSLSAERYGRQEQGLAFQFAEGDKDIEIRRVTGIIGIQQMPKVPDQPEYVRGAIKLRGKVIPVKAIRTPFQLPRQDFGECTCMVVVDGHGMAMGLVLARTDQGADIRPRQIEAPDCTRIGQQDQYFQGI